MFKQIFIIISYIVAGSTAGGILIIALLVCFYCLACYNCCTDYDWTSTTDRHRRLAREIELRNGPPSPSSTLNLSPAKSEAKPPDTRIIITAVAADHGNRDGACEIVGGSMAEPLDMTNYLGTHM